MKKTKCNRHPLVLEIDLTDLTPQEYNRKIELLNELMRDDSDCDKHHCCHERKEKHEDKHN